MNIVCRKISVVMNCLNSIRYLREAVDSVYAQSYSNWEIILWDNASEEDVRGVLSGYDQRLRYFRGDRTVALGKARNLAMAEATGDLVAFLDCDDVWLPEKLEQQVGCFDDPQVGLAYSDWILFNEHGYRRVQFGERGAPAGVVFEEVLFNNFTCLSTLMVRTSLVGDSRIEFDPRLTYVEDSDFVTRVARIASFAYVPRPLTLYRMHAGSATASKAQAFRDEEDYLAGKYRLLFPEFSSRYAKRFEAGIVKARAIDHWRKGNRRLARRLLFAQFARNWRYALIYLVLFLPYPWVNWARMRFSRRATGYYY